jgi:uncharacterized membrane protein
MRYLVAYIATAVVFFALDFCWLSLASGPIYRARLGEMLLARPNLGVAGVFYLLYVAGIVALAVVPSLGTAWWSAGLAGLVLGLVAYGTYDFTNLATLRGWSLELSLIDLAWGTVLTGLAASVGHLAARWLTP